MMFHNDYQLDRLIDHRQNSIRQAVLQRPRPSALRIRIGMALIALGEHLRGRTTAVSTTPAPRLHTAHESHRVLA